MRVHCGKLDGPTHHRASALNPGAQPHGALDPGAQPHGALDPGAQPHGSFLPKYLRESLGFSRLLPWARFRFSAHQKTSASQRIRFSFESAYSSTRRGRHPVKGSAFLRVWGAVTYCSTDGVVTDTAEAGPGPPPTAGIAPRVTASGRGRAPDRDCVCTLPACPGETLAVQRPRVGGTLPSTVPHTGYSDLK